jgi:hypothetical protein
VFADGSGAGARATALSVRRVEGRVGRAIWLDGRRSSVTVALPGVRRPRSGITVEAWVKARRNDRWMPVVAGPLRDGVPSWALYSGTPRGGPFFTVRAGGRHAYSRRTTAKLPGRWVHLAATYDGTHLRVYRNGRRVGAGRAAGPLDGRSGALRIGAIGRSGPRFRGSIDELRIYRRALSRREILADMRASAGPPGAQPGPTPPIAGTPPRSGTFTQFGVVATRDMTTIDNVRQRADAGITRIGFDIDTPVASMREYVARAAQNRVRPILLAEFANRVATPDEARGLAAWAKEFGPGGTFWNGRADGAYAPRYIEFGSETSYTYQGTWDRGGEYALRVRDAYQAIQAANPRVGLLVQADDTSITTARWVNDMFDAVPNLASMVAMWTVHPYGPRSRWEPRLQALVSQTAARGAPASIPIAITEWGIATDDGRTLSDNYEWPRDMTYQQAADALTSSLAAMTQRFPNRIAVILYYYSFDLEAHGATSNREDYFGYLKSDFSDKGPLTDAVRAAAARYPGPS